ncbi:defensin Tk-AMP-D5 [Brachypodium distachyon]|uniref:Knottins-like domain-containing protein n=1 Tax=Brachypodium distachyon TaxID=15368 RepID=I1IW23_BRADI|nr:defensin Tk-AMP-D5 [Brachypodium distachyon]KQJ81749.1 hypothetical protein BRADI_5g02840v3 [Brachypodium distachyon]PNT60645.1 hypothetical protein BRADI_5g02840v3 [Brachypodium distachyon]|eukprot:XP_003581053.1 defensin Tk-AMP-D5 [Brachypodium distachyon]
MESSRKFFPTVVLFLLLVVATEVAPTAARECETESTKFEGLCIMHSHCPDVCVTEGFTGGKCSTWKRKCMCTKEC